MNSNAAFTRGCQQVGFGNVSPLLSLDEPTTSQIQGVWI